MPKTSTKRFIMPGLAVVGACCLVLPLGGCVTTDRVVTDKIISDDPRLRHPIAVIEAPETLDIFVGPGGRIDNRTAGQIREFGTNAGRTGLRPIVVQLPVGASTSGGARAALPAIRRLLAQGSAHGYVDVGSYPIGDPRLASPVRLSYQTIKAKVTSRCGEWPRDLASGSSIDGWENEHYWNYGCATQSNFAAQIDDPRDLVHQRAEEPSDVAMRTRAITNIRKGEDPGTNWRVKNTNLGAAGG